MSLIEVILAAEAAAQERAVRRTTFRHRFLSEEPFVVTAYNLSGEAAAPLGICWGTRPDACEVVIAAEPRNRVSRFAAINAFAKALTDHVAPHLKLTILQTKAGHRFPVATSAPQIVVPNRATRDYIGARLGRSLRYLGLGDTHEVPEETIWAGAHLSFLAGHALFPGQSMFTAMTELLGQLFVTGQSGLENENLATLLAWIENKPRGGRSRIEKAESAVYGPVADPGWEVELEPLVRAWTVASRASDAKGTAAAEKQVRSLVEPKLRDGYAATWRAIQLAKAVPPAPGAAKRWDEFDLREWSGHARRAQRDVPRFSRRHDALLAARMLERWSRALEQLEFDEAIEDPMVLAELDAGGRCLAGRVTSLDLEHREVKPGNTRQTRVPLVEVAISNRPTLLPGDHVRWAANPKVGAEIREMSANRALLAILEGHSNGTVVPRLRDDAMFAALSTFGGRSPDLPDEVPWTHTSEVEADAGADGSPDLSPEELVALPVAGAVGPDETPGVVV